MEFIKWDLEKAKTSRSKGYYMSGGYKYGRAPYHPYANKSGYVKMSRLILENHLGRYLSRDEKVWLIDGDKNNLSIENLRLYSSDDGDFKKIREENNWKTLIDFPRYEISDKGHLYDKIRKILIRGWKNNGGYITYDVSNERRKVKKKAHRLVAENFLEKVQGKNIVNHIDGNKLNNSVSNLEWVTAKENVVHAFEIGLHKVGEQHHYCKLTDEDAKEIYSKYQTGKYTYAKLATEYNVDTSYIGRIVRKELRFSDIIN